VLVAALLLIDVKVFILLVYPTSERILEPTERVVEPTAVGWL
jgi:hypothetical protein